MRHKSRTEKAGCVVAWQSFNTGTDPQSNRDSALSGWWREELKCKQSRGGEAEQHGEVSGVQTANGIAKLAGEGKESREREKYGLTAC